MSTGLLKTRKNFMSNMRSFKSDPNLFWTDEFNEIIKNINRASRGRGDQREQLSQSAPDADLGVSLISKSTEDFFRDIQLMKPKSIYCPFCAEDFMFDITFKSHLRKKHHGEIDGCAQNRQTIDDAYESHKCPCNGCTGYFYYYALIPIHLAQHHDANQLKTWQNLTANLDVLKTEKKNCPSIEILSASSGLSDMMKSLDISGGKPEPATPETPKLKSILKKRSNYSGRIIFNSSSASLRRMGEEVTKRGNGHTRRSLRFELPAEEFNYTAENFIDTLEKMNNFRDDCTEDTKESCFKRIKKSLKMKKNKKAVADSSQIHTSTPTRGTSAATAAAWEFNPDVTDSKKPTFWRRIFPKKLENVSPTKNVPACFNSERFQCAICHSKFDENCDLLEHLKKFHNTIRRFFRPQYSCGQCQKKFFKNGSLIKHTREHQMPSQ